MEYVQTHSTKKLVYLLPGIVFALIGGLLTPIMLYGVIVEHEKEFIVLAIISLLLLGFGFMFIYHYFFPKTGKGIITEHSIRCELDGKIKKEILKEDINFISVPSSYRYSIKAIMKKGKGFQKTINSFYFQDLENFYEQLLIFDYKASYSPKK